MASANAYTTTELLADIRRKGHIPTSQTPFLDADLLALADSELQTGILRQILSVKENYYLTYADYAVTSDNTYTIPTRAIGQALANVEIISGTSIYQCARTERRSQFATDSSPCGTYAFYLQGNSVVLLPSPGTGTIRLWYYQRPNVLVVVADAAQVSSIASPVVTCVSLPTTFSTNNACDFIKDQPGFDWISIDKTPTIVSSPALTFSSVSSSLAAGDWVALAGQTPVPQIPVEFRPLLAQRVVVKYYEIQGYNDKMDRAQKKLEAMEKDVFMLINPRVAEAPKRLVADSGVIGGYSQWRRWRAT